VDTSACISIVNVGIDDSHEGLNMSIYPNPTQNFFQIDFGVMIEKGQIEISNVAGEVISVSELYNARNHQVNIENFDSGLYFVKFSTRESVSFYKVVKN
jgi:hypothetical protein